jgi:DnaJ domain
LVLGDIFKNNRIESENGPGNNFSIIGKCRVCGEMVRFTLISSQKMKKVRGRELQTEIWAIDEHGYKENQCKTSNQQFRREFVEGRSGLKHSKIKQTRQKNIDLNQYKTIKENQAKQDQAKQDQAKQDQAKQDQAKQKPTERINLTLKECYKILEVDENATPNEINNSYKRLSLHWHPDKHTYYSRKKIAEEEMKLINLAKKELENAGKMQT